MFPGLFGKAAIEVLKDYEKQKSEGRNPVFKGRDIGLSDDEIDYWK